MRDWRRRRVGCKKSKPNPISAPPVKKFPFIEEIDDEMQCDKQVDYHNSGPSLSPNIEHERKVAELEEKFKEAKANADLWFFRAQELESDLQASRLQKRKAAAMAKNLKEGFGKTDEATSQCSSKGQSERDKWACRLCEEYEAEVVVLPCSHLSLCFDCSFKAATCPVCGTLNTEFFHVRRN